MKRYEIRCTESQTRKALELGAPIKTSIHIEPPFSMANGCLPYEEEIEILEKTTAEEMIGWMEENGIEDVEIVYYITSNCWHYAVFGKGKHDILSDGDFSSRKEATLAAIDAALEYLTNNKK